MPTTSQSQIPNPQSQIPAPLHPSSFILPPSARDFSLHRQNQIEHASTRQLAEKFKLSQTRVRQIVARTSRWIAAQLPAQTELQQEQEARLARALAADALQHQLELLNTLWDATHETKFHRQLLRVITAKARLATLPGALDLLLPEEREGEAPAEPTTPAHRGTHAPAPQFELCNLKSEIPSALQSAIPNPKSEISAASSFIPPPSSFPAPPPSEDCSPNRPETHDFTPQAPSPASPTPDSQTTSSHSYEETPDYLRGLKLFESRLLTLIQNTNPGNAERLASLNKSLADIRQEITKVEPIIRAKHPVTSVNLSPNSTPNVQQESPDGCGRSPTEPPLSDRQVSTAQLAPAP